MPELWNTGKSTPPPLGYNASARAHGSPHQQQSNEQRTFPHRLDVYVLCVFCHVFHVTYVTCQPCQPSLAQPTVGRASLLLLAQAASTPTLASCSGRMRERAS